MMANSRMKVTFMCLLLLLAVIFEATVENTGEKSTGSWVNGQRISYPEALSARKVLILVSVIPISLMMWLRKPKIKSPIRLLGTASEAVLVVLLAARDKILRKVGKDTIRKILVYCSDQTHASLQKAFKVGATSSAAVDPLLALGKISQSNGLWFHVDAAYAGSTCICPEFRPYLDGVEEADSFNMNAHKFFLTNFDCSALWVKERHALIQSLSTSAEYLENKLQYGDTN
ncbi:phenylacetaldehyde synthase-like isoform X3 [Henckelia pumila]|uniref:phenylacetaldehyde synthase-like isoform X3 n=1 Tax=Henckelia pumila TaxID=405737 RepID=UPI003C6DC8BC